MSCHLDRSRHSPTRAPSLSHDAIREGDAARARRRRARALLRDRASARRPRRGDAADASQGATRSSRAALFFLFSPSLLAPPRPPDPSFSRASTPPNRSFSRAKPLAGEARPAQGPLRRGRRREPRDEPDAPAHRARRRPVLAPRRRPQRSRDLAAPRGRERAHGGAPRAPEAADEAYLRRDRAERPGERRRPVVPVGRALRVLREDAQGEGVPDRVPPAARGRRARARARGGRARRERGREDAEVLLAGRVQGERRARRARVQRRRERVRDVRDSLQRLEHRRASPGRHSRRRRGRVLGPRGRRGVLQHAGRVAPIEQGVAARDGHGAERGRLRLRRGRRTLQVRSYTNVFHPSPGFNT